MMHRQTRGWIIGMGALLLCAFAPSLALAGQAWVTIYEPDVDTQKASLNDSGFLLPATNPASYGGIFGSGTTPAAGVSTELINEAPGVLGEVNMTFDYNDTHPLAVGASQTVNYNIFEPGTTSFTQANLSDTLSITFTGTSGSTNTSVDIHWRSDSSDEVPPTLLPSGHELIEPTTGFSPDLNSDISAITTLNDFHLQYQSVPEPSSVVMMGLGALVLGGLAYGRRRKS